MLHTGQTVYSWFIKRGDGSAYTGMSKLVLVVKGSSFYVRFRKVWIKSVIGNIGLGRNVIQ